MARKTNLMPLKEFNELSVTPLIDLTFLLLITFLITYPLLEQGVHVNLPQAKADQLEPGKTRTISIDIEGGLYLDDQPVSEERLGGEMRMLVSSDPEITVFVRADRDLKYSRVVDVIKIIKDSGISRMALITQAE